MHGSHKPLTIHVVRYGFPLCDFSTPLHDWPDDQAWVGLEFLGTVKESQKGNTICKSCEERAVKILQEEKKCSTTP